MTKRPMSVDDIMRFELVGNPLLSPDGQRVVFEQTVTEEEDDSYSTHLMMALTDGSSPRPLTSSGNRNTGAVWSPDGDKLAFVSDRAYGTQVWILPMEGGEARRITRFRHGIHSLVWSPDGRTVYGLTAVDAKGSVALFDEGLSEKDAKEQLDEERKDWAESPKRYDRLQYKMDGEGLSDHRFSQLVSIDVESGAVQQLTSGDYGAASPVVSPDGKFIAFVSNRRANPDLEWWASDVYRVPAAGGELELLTNELSASQLAYSPDGRHLAVLGHGEELFTYWSAAHQQLFVMPSDGGAYTELSRGFPDTLGDTCLSDVQATVRTQPPIWSADGQWIYVLSSREGASEIVRFAANDDSTREGEVVIGGSREIFGFATNGGSTFVISYATSTHPGAIAWVDIAGVSPKSRQPRAVTESMAMAQTPFFPAERRLDRSNAFLDEVALTEPTPFWYTSQDEWQVQGWVMKPYGFTPGKKYPVLLEIHGGPQLNYGYSMFHEMQWIAAQGYAIVFVNPRGGMSYGQEFVNAVRLHYGEGDAADVLNGLDAALSQFDFLDASRVAVTGGSYGGFMTNWLLGHTDRFFAAVSQRSICNWISFYGASDVGPLFVESQHGVTELDDLAELWKHSPLKYAKNVKTPLLLIHSENDLRCPMEQAEQFYTLIKRIGGEVELLRVPNASHGLSRNGKPKLRVKRLHALFDFINDRLPSDFH